MEGALIVCLAVAAGAGLACIAQALVMAGAWCLGIVRARHGRTGGNA